jgi:hypothetical protein
MHLGSIDIGTKLNAWNKPYPVLPGDREGFGQRGHRIVVGDGESADAHAGGLSHQFGRRKGTIRGGCVGVEVYFGEVGSHGEV